MLVMFRVTNKRFVLCVVMLNFFMLSVVMLKVFMLNFFMLNVFMLSVVMLNVQMPFHYAESRKAECRGANQWP